MSDFLNWLASIFTWTFENILETSQNIPNIIFIVVITFGLGYWVWWQGKYNKKAEREGGLK